MQLRPAPGNDGGRSRADLDVSLLACQRRTGSAFGMQARWPKDRVDVTGRYGVRPHLGRRRGGDVSLCPDCGATVFWTAEHEGLDGLDRGPDRRVRRSSFHAADSLCLRVATVSVAVPSGRDRGRGTVVHAPGSNCPASRARKWSAAPRHTFAFLGHLLRPLRRPSSPMNPGATLGRRAFRRCLGVGVRAVSRTEGKALASGLGSSRDGSDGTRPATSGVTGRKRRRDPPWSDPKRARIAEEVVAVSSARCYALP